MWLIYLWLTCSFHRSEIASRSWTTCTLSGSGSWLMSTSHRVLKERFIEITRSSKTSRPTMMTLNLWEDKTSKEANKEWTLILDGTSSWRSSSKRPVRKPSSPTWSSEEQASPESAHRHQLAGFTGHGSTWSGHQAPPSPDDAVHVLWDRHETP